MIPVVLRNEGIADFDEVADNLDAADGPTHLWADHNRLRTVDERMMKHRTLTKLWLNNNRLFGFPMAVTALRNLEYLNVSCNEIERLPDLSGLPNLTVLQASVCGMTDVDPGALQPKLRTLDLFGNRLASVPDDIGRCVELERLSLHGNLLEALPARFPESVRWLSLHNNRLASVPARCLPPRVARVSLHMNRLTRVPPDLETVCEDVVCLSLFDNRLTEVRLAIPALAELGCMRNPLKRVDVRGCSSLRRLWLNNTELDEFPADVPDSLELLWLCDTRVRTVPRIPRLRSLRFVYASPGTEGDPSASYSVVRA